MATLSPNQIGALIVAYWQGAPAIYGAGLTDDGNGNISRTPKKDPAAVAWLDTAIAICLAESGGNPNAKNPHSSASGLWQVMVSVHPQIIKDAIRYVDSNDDSSGTLTIFDPRVNTFAASRIYQDAGSKWTPWEAYTSGSYKRHKGHGEKVWAYLNNPKNIQAGIDKLAAEINNPNIAVPEVAGNALNKIGDSLTPNWMNPVLSFVRDAALPIGMFVLAVVLLILGIVFIISGSKTVQKTAGAVAKVAV